MLHLQESLWSVLRLGHGICIERVPTHHKQKIYQHIAKLLNQDDNEDAVLL